MNITRWPDKPIRSSPAVLDMVSNYIALSKVDGFRCLSCIDENGKAFFRSRVDKPLPVSEKVKKAVEALNVPRMTILDGEWMLRRPGYDGPECIYMFTPMVIAGEWVGHLSFKTRWQWINGLNLPVDDLSIRESDSLPDNPLIIPASVTSNFRKFYDENRGIWRTEGIVAYAPDGAIVGCARNNHKSRDMMKFKWREGSDGRTEV